MFDGPSAVALTLAKVGPQISARVLSPAKQNIYIEGNESRTIMQPSRGPYSLYILTSQMRPPPELMRRPSLSSLLSTRSIRLSHFKSVHSLVSTSTAILRVNWALPTLLHPLPTSLPFTALSSPPRQSTVLHFEPSARQVKANSPLSPRATFFGRVARARQPVQARRRLPRYLNPTGLIYLSLCQGHRAHEPTLQRSSRAVPKDWQNPLLSNLYHRMQRRTAHRRPLASPVN